MDLSELKKRLAGRRIFHAYIVTGGGAASRLETGRLIAAAAVCSGTGQAPCGVCRDCVKARKGVHPDIQTVEKTGREHTVDTMRDVRSRAVIVPNEAARSVFILADADDMNPQAQNAMLKVFEEPPPHAVFVLLAANPMRLLETVRSRCETVTLPPETAAGTLSAPAEDLLRALISGDRIGLVRAVGAVDKLGRNELPGFLDEVRLGALRDAGRLPGERLEKLLQALDQADKMAAVNVSAVHIATMLLAETAQ